MKYKFLSSVKIEEHEEVKDNIVLTENENGELEIDPFKGWYDDENNIDVVLDRIDRAYDTGFDDSLYEETMNEHRSKVVKVIQNIDGFRKYSLNSSYLVSHKEARTSVEEKRPFIIAKRGKKLSKVEDIDSIYRTDIKIKISDNPAQRVGFLVVSAKGKELILKDKNKKKYRGIANDEYMIYKKKPFNHKKLGCIKLEESTPYKDLYVEVVESRGYKWLAALFIILGISGLVIFTRDYTDWHINWEKLRVYKSQEIIERNERELEIGINATPVLKDSLLNLMLTSEESENITFTAKLYDENNNLLWESEELAAGEGADQVELSKDLEVGEHNCILKCDSMRNGSYIGTIESSLVIKVKETE